MQDLKSFGTNKPNDEKYTLAAQKFIMTFLTDIQFTLNSFSLKLNFYEEISSILLIGKGTQITGLASFSSTTLNIPCELFSPNKLFKAKEFRNKTREFDINATNHTLSLATAISYGPHDDFNLRKKEFAKKHFPLMNKQLVVGALLTIIILATIGTRGFLQIMELSSHLKLKEKQAIGQLKKIFRQATAL